MHLLPRHLAAIQLIITEQFSGKTQAQLAEHVGVARETFGRWLQDATFQAALLEAHREWRKALDHIPLSHRRRRVEELQRLYDDLPDRTVERTVSTRKDGSQFEREVEHNNHAMKAGIIRDIAMEIGGDAAEKLDELRAELASGESRSTSGNGHPHLKVMVGGNGKA